jgi:hypothetical protein
MPLPGQQSSLVAQGKDSLTQTQIPGPNFRFADAIAGTLET